MPIRSGILRTRKAHHHRVIRADHWKSRRNKRNLRARKQHKAGSSPADFDANVASTPCQPSVIGREPKQNKKRCTFLPTYNNRLWEKTTKKKKKKRVSKCPRPKCGVKLSGMCPKATPFRIPTCSTGEKHFHDGPKNLAVIRPYIIQGQREEEKKRPTTLANAIRAVHRAASINQSPSDKFAIVFHYVSAPLQTRPLNPDSVSFPSQGMTRSCVCDVSGEKKKKKV